MRRGGRICVPGRRRHVTRRNTFRGLPAGGGGRSRTRPDTHEHVRGIFSAPPDASSSFQVPLTTVGIADRPSTATRRRPSTPSDTTEGDPGQRERESSCYYFCVVGFVIFYYSTGTLTARLFAFIGNRRPVARNASNRGSTPQGSNRSPAAVESRS